MKKIFEPAIARAARAYTGLGHIALAQKANVASRTIYKLEKDGRVTKETLEKILQVLFENGVSLIRDEASGQICGLRFAKIHDPDAATAE
ncbi:helix-turn-helix transcriptional regulator [Rhizobium sp. YJ-22]|uniref:helix-turn-helix domain-containing protein n=1 Tax=Rhizobium sp. YJ-22 TaxID=3037556 RepID=UPI0024121731|nr:helix-turn-helix transcriptional regulator [Rhizobium sp. YJ-22]MDG3576830.1 helix-turn-helix transcriptional regulator [Rhizobium sp. YJ-22]